MSGTDIRRATCAAALASAVALGIAACGGSHSGADGSTPASFGAGATGRTSPAVGTTGSTAPSPTASPSAAQSKKPGVYPSSLFSADTAIPPAALASAEALFAAPTAPAGPAVPVPATLPLPPGSTVLYSVRPGGGSVQQLQLSLTSGRQGMTYWRSALPAAGFTGVRVSGVAGGTITFAGNGFATGSGLLVSSGIATVRLIPG